MHCTAISEEQRQVDPARQAAAEAEGSWSSCAHLLTDGSHAGHPCRVHAAQAVWLPGHFFTSSVLRLSQKIKLQEFVLLKMFDEQVQCKQAESEFSCLG